jgi:hypothetical protein
MARIGSVAAAPILGDQFVSLYVGAERVPTVPQAPNVTFAEWNGDATLIGVQFGGDGLNDGGSTLTATSYYFDGTLQAPDLDGDEFSTDFTGSVVRVSVSNAIGESLLSDPVVVVDNS